MDREHRPAMPGRAYQWIRSLVRRRVIPAGPLTIVLAGVVGLLAGYGSVIFSVFIHTVSSSTVGRVMELSAAEPLWYAGLLLLPMLGLLLVAWITRRFAPEAEGHGVPEVITAVARHDGVIRPRVALVKILVSGLCIGTGGSVGREGPIIQIGSTLGSMAGQWLHLSPRHVKILLASGAAAGISATFNAPIAGVIFASEVILGSFAVESITPVMIASVLAAVVQAKSGEHGFNPAFPHIEYFFEASWSELPSHIVLGLICGLMAVCFIKLLYATEDLGKRYLSAWWTRAMVFGGLVGLAGVLYPMTAPASPNEASPKAAHADAAEENHQQTLPPLFGVGYDVVTHCLHLENADHPTSATDELATSEREKSVRLSRQQMSMTLLWLLPLALLKPLATSLTLAGGGSGGIFAPSLYMGAALGGSFGIAVNLIVPEYAAHPGLYAIVGMGAVVAGTTHGVLSAILIVYEMTDDYDIILPIMIAAGLASVVARMIDSESIYEKKLSRRGESVARGHDLHHVEHIMVRDVMVREFPSVKNTDTVPEIIRVARAHTNFEHLPVMDANDKLVGIIRPADLHRVIDTDVALLLVNAEDIAYKAPIVVSPAENLLEALRDFGTYDVETLPVEAGSGSHRRLVGLLIRSDVMRRYREEMLRR